MNNTFGVDILPANDPERLAALHRYQIIDTPPEEVFNNLSQLVAEVFDVPIALISLVDKDRVFFKGNVGMTGVKHVDRGVSLCSLAVLSPKPTVITRPLEDPCLLANPLVHGKFGLRFYAGAPIVTADGFNIGTVCILDKKERTFSDNDEAKLVRFARTVMHTIESRLISLNQLATQREIDNKSSELNQVYQELQFLTNTVPQLVWARDPVGNPVFLNDQWSRFTGFGIETLKEKGWDLVLHPDDAEKARQAWQVSRQNSTEYEVEYRLKRHDGEYRWFLGRAIPLKDEAGNVIKWYGTSTDIHDSKNFLDQMEKKVQERTTDLQQQRNLLDSILKQSPSGITVYKALHDSSGGIIDFQCILANHAAETFTGISLDERFEKTVLQQTPALALSPLWEKAVAAITEGIPFQTEYYYEPAKAWLELSVVKMDEEHLINVFRDITPIKAAQVELEKHVRELKQANAELEHFAYAASHDMKEPIRKVHIFTDRLLGVLSANLTPDQKHYFDRLKAAAYRMNSLIDDLLVYTQINDGLPVAETIDLNGVLTVVQNDLDLEIEETGAVIEVEELPSIEGHPRQVQQVFHNLLVNAIKYRKQNEIPQIQVSCRKVKGVETGLPFLNNEHRAYYYQVDVRDNGIGFEPQHAERIFGVFQRLHNSEYKGSGIGLSIVRKAMQNHGGYVQAISEPMGGATFRLFFPVGQFMPATPSSSLMQAGQ